MFSKLRNLFILFFALTQIYPEIVGSLAVIYSHKRQEKFEENIFFDHEQPTNKQFSIFKRNIEVEDEIDKDYMADLNVEYYNGDEVASSVSENDDSEGPDEKENEEVEKTEEKEESEKEENEEVEKTEEKEESEKEENEEVEKTEEKEESEKEENEEVEKTEEKEESEKEENEEVEKTEEKEESEKEEDKNNDDNKDTEEKKEDDKEDDKVDNKENENEDKKEDTSNNKNEKEDDRDDSKDDENKNKEDEVDDENSICGCFRRNAPVCGANLKTYKNSCLAMCELKTKYLAQAIAHDGECTADTERQFS